MRSLILLIVLGLSANAHASHKRRQKLSLGEYMSRAAAKGKVFRAEFVHRAQKRGVGLIAKTRLSVLIKPQQTLVAVSKKDKQGTFYPILLKQKYYLGKQGQVGFPRLDSALDVEVEPIFVGAFSQKVIRTQLDFGPYGGPRLELRHMPIGDTARIATMVEGHVFENLDTRFAVVTGDWTHELAVKVSEANDFP